MADAAGGSGGAIQAALPGRCSDPGPGSGLSNAKGAVAAAAAACGCVLLVPPRGAPAAADVTRRFLDVLLRAEGQDSLRLRVRAGSPWLGVLSNKRVQATLAAFPVRPPAALDLHGCLS